tara:strand:+ start:1343 stop:2032 length:690 start_codon:yes stop_codon:yes gene_type:complete
MPTHFTDGVSNVTSSNPLYQFGMLDPTKYHIIFDDFDKLPIAANYTLTAISGGSGTSAITSQDVDGGVARLTTAADELDGIAAEWLSESFLLESGKKTFIKTRLSVGDAVQSAWMVGLHSTDTTPRDATLRFFFESVDASADVYFNIDDNTTDADSSALATLSDDTYITLAAYYDGVTSVELFADDVRITTMTDIGLPGAEMALGFGYWNGAAGAETTDFDYVFIAKER